MNTYPYDLQRLLVCTNYSTTEGLLEFLRNQDGVRIKKVIIIDLIILVIAMIKNNQRHFLREEITIITIRMVIGDFMKSIITDQEIMVTRIETEGVTVMKI